MPTKSNTNRSPLYKNVSALTVMLLSGLVAHGRSQSPAPRSPVAAPTYDVVSIKPDKSGSGSLSFSDVGETFKATNVTIGDLIFNSFNLTSKDLIFGLPAWTRSARFDVDAKIVNPDKAQIDNLTDDQRMAMILGILKDRFHLQAHLEIKTLPVYDLVIARGGPKFIGDSEASKDIAAAIANKNLTNGGMTTRDGELTAGDVPVSSLTYTLTAAVGRTVIDKTGLTGKYNFELKWTPEREAGANPDNGQADAQNATSSIFTALEEQLGLKLQPSKGPVQTLVVDHVEMPSEN